MTATLTTSTKPHRDVVLYDGKCRFCRSQIAILRRLDVTGRLELVSLHDPRVAQDFPEIPLEDLMQEMIVVDRSGQVYRGVRSLRLLSRRLPLLWPLAIPLHLPGSLPVWSWLYRLIARNRYRIAGTCDDGTCRPH